MYLKQLILVLTLIVQTLIFAQKTDATACSEKLNQAEQAFVNAKYSESNRLYLSVIRTCDSMSQFTFDHLIQGLKTSISIEKNLDTRKNLTDTLLVAYSLAEPKGYYDQKDDLSRALALIRSTKPNYQKADELFVRGLSTYGAEAGETVLIAFYFNLYELYKNCRPEEKSAIKNRMIEAYFRIKSWITIQKMSAKTSETIDNLYHSIFRSCKDITPELSVYLSTLPIALDQKKSTLLNYKSMLEEFHCTDSKEYEDVIDSLILLDPNYEIWLKRAEIYKRSAQYSKEFSALYFAKGSTSDPSELMNVQFLMATCQYNLGHFKEAFQLAIALQNTKNDPSKKLAAQCILASLSDCGNDSIDQKMNLYYALELLNSIENADDETMELKNKITQQLPTSEDLQLKGIKKGQLVKLTCWNKSVKVL